MQTFKKVAAVSVVFILLLAMLTAVIVEPFKHSESGYYMDAKLRESLAGQIDYIVIGASHGLAAFVPQIIDERLDCFSYNLSGSLMPMYNRVYMLNKELNRNPIDTVVLEVSYDALTRPQNTEYGDGDSVTLLRLDSFWERLSYMLKYISVDDWLNIYCRDMTSSLSFWKSALRHDVSSVDYEAKGFHATNAMDTSLPESEILSSYNERDAIGDFRDENILQFEALIQTAIDHGCRVFVVSTPIADSFIWKSDDWNDYINKVNSICAEHGISFYDFSLLKTKGETINDTESFYDVAHMSEVGAYAFTAAFCDCMEALNEGTDISDWFYSDYDEAKQHSPYMEYYKAHAPEE